MAVLATGRGFLRGGLLTALLLLAPFAAGPRRAAPALPPPPVWTAIPNHIQVVALWGADGLPADRPALAADEPAGDLTLLAKSASPAFVAPASTLHYGITLTNTTNLTQTFHVTDTLPVGVAGITNTVPRAGCSYTVFTATLTAACTLAAFQGDVITATGAPPYTEISGTLSYNICKQAPFDDCDDNAITLAGVPFRYLGVDYNAITLDSNGFVMPVFSGMNLTGIDAINQHLPMSATPNAVIAPFWDNLDLNGINSADPGGGDWWWAILHNGITQADYLVVEWHHAQKKGDGGTDYNFQVWIQLHVEHITFAYDTPAFTGSTSSATVGFENSDGTLGHSYLYNGAGQVPAPGSQLQLVADFDVAHLGFDVKGQASLPGCGTIANTAQLGVLSGIYTATATTATFGPCLRLPLIFR